MNFLLFLVLSLLLCLVLSLDCARDCGGCKTGRCDVFGCPSGQYCCLDLNQYGACCSSCGPPPLPPSCLNIPQNTDCAFYENCIQKYHDCQVVKNVAYPKCQQYLKLQANLTDKGVEWSKFVRYCIQQKIATNVLSKYGTGFDCSQVQSTFFDEHLDCYVHPLPGLPYGFCDLGVGDQYEIIKNGAGIIISKYWYEPLKTGAELKYYCDLSYTQGFVNAVQQTGSLSLEKANKYLSEKLSQYSSGGKLFSEQFFTEAADTNGTIYVIYQVSNYTGPNTVPKYNLTVSQVASFVSDSIALASNFTFNLTEYNGKPFVNQTLLTD